MKILKGTLTLVAFLVAMFVSILLNMALIHNGILFPMVGTLIGLNATLILTWFVAFVATLGVLVLLDEIVQIIDDFGGRGG